MPQSLIRYVGLGVPAALPYLQALAEHYPERLQILPIGGVYLTAPPWNAFLPYMGAKLAGVRSGFINIVCGTLGFPLGAPRRRGKTLVLATPDTIFSAYRTAQTVNIAIVLPPIPQDVQGASSAAVELEGYDWTICPDGATQGALESHGASVAVCPAESLHTGLSSLSI